MPSVTIFETAEVLEHKQVSIAPITSQYFEDGHIEKTFGTIARFGIQDNRELRLRLEYFAEYDQYFFEVSEKRALSENTAFSVPFQVYNITNISFNDGQFGDERSIILGTDPRFIWSKRHPNNKLVVSFVPHCIVSMMVSQGFSAMIAPGCALGLGLSSNLDKWALRTEFSTLYLQSGGILTAIGVGIEF